MKKPCKQEHLSDMKDLTLSKINKTLTVIMELHIGPLSTRMSFTLMGPDIFAMLKILLTITFTASIKSDQLSHSSPIMGKLRKSMLTCKVSLLIKNKTPQISYSGIRTCIKI
jgi:hypothetical protein